jgi:hypothetical protein
MEQLLFSIPRSFSFLICKRPGELLNHPEILSVGHWLQTTLLP